MLVGSSAGAGAAPPSSDGELLKSSSILQEEVDLATARIRSSKQFEAYLAATPSSVAFKLPQACLVSSAVAWFLRRGVSLPFLMTD